VLVRQHQAHVVLRERRVPDFGIRKTGEAGVVPAEQVQCTPLSRLMGTSQTLGALVVVLDLPHEGTAPVGTGDPLDLSFQPAPARQPRLPRDDKLCVAKGEAMPGEVFVRDVVQPGVVVPDAGERVRVAGIEGTEQVACLVPGLLQGGVGRELPVGRGRHGDLLSRWCLASASSGRKKVRGPSEPVM